MTGHVRGDVRKAAAEAEYPDVLSDDVPAPVPWWWTEAGRSQCIEQARADERGRIARAIEAVRSPSLSATEIGHLEHAARIARTVDQ